MKMNIWKTVYDNIEIGCILAMVVLFVQLAYGQHSEVFRTLSTVCFLGHASMVVALNVQKKHKTKQLEQ